MSGRYVALLRGINVGKAKRIAMADLRGLVEGLGFTEVSTLLNSGNVVFTAGKGSGGRGSGKVDGKADGKAGAKAASLIEAGLEKEVGVTSRVTVLSEEELADVMKANTLVSVADNHSRLLVGIAQSAEVVGRLRDIAKQDWSPERLALGKGAGGSGRAIYMWIPTGVIESKLNAAVSRALGDSVTSRNWATMLKLRDMAAGS